MKRLLSYFIVLVVVLLAIGAYQVYKTPRTNNQQFAADAADQTLTPFQEIAKARVFSIIDDSQQNQGSYSRIYETLKVMLLDGADKGKEIQVVYEDTGSAMNLKKINPGETVVLGKIQTPVETSYVVIDRYRLPALALIAGIFLVLAIIFGRLRGVSSIVGLAFSAAILLWFIIPNILAGKNPTLVTLVGAGIIALISMFLAHGFNRRAALAVISTLVTLAIAEGLALWFVSLAHLLGNGSEGAYLLQQGFFGAINLQGLLLGGIIIGTLGVLNDITVSQAATVQEIHAANPALSIRQLYRSGSSVGREHIASLINTLVLAYAGSSLPLFLLFAVRKSQPAWTILNSEMISEEIVRTLVGSVALVLAVPVCTLLASYYFKKAGVEPPASAIKGYKKFLNFSSNLRPRLKKPLLGDDYWDQAKNKVAQNKT